MTSAVAPALAAAAPAGPFLRAARGLPVERTPVWFMRQAGRTLPEYRRLRERWTLLEMCADAALCAEVTLQPMRRMPLDAAVMFGDIMVPLQGAGVALDIVEKVGPVIAEPIRDLAGVERLRPLDPERDCGPILEAVRIVRRELAPDRAVLGFAGRRSRSRRTSSRGGRRATSCTPRRSCTARPRCGTRS
jgi:uroporphyrinogen decarboxylase